MEWNQTQVDFMVGKFNDGLSYHQIAMAMASEFEQVISRNAVLGKLFRLRMSRPPPIKSKPAIYDRPKKRTAKPLTRKPARPVPPTEPLPAMNCNLYQLNAKRCHWPYGNDPPFIYCGSKVIRGKPYCRFHFLRSLRSVELAEQERKRAHPPMP